MPVWSYLSALCDGAETHNVETLKNMFTSRLHRLPTEKEIDRLRNASFASLCYELLLMFKREQPVNLVKMTKRVPVLMLFYNNEDYCRVMLPKVVDNIQIALQTLGLEPVFYMYENDSIDQTPRLLKRFNGHVVSERLPAISSYAIGRTTLRCNRIAFLRNAMVGWALPDIIKAPYVMCVDSNIALSTNSVTQLFQAMVTPSVVMATPNTVDASCPTHYYDTYAFTPLHKPAKATNIHCPKEDCFKCEGKSPMPVLMHVQSAFAGACVVSSQALLKSFWSSKGDLCEHVAFCRHLAPGRVVIVRDAISVWLSSFKVYHEHKHVRKLINALLRQ